MSKINACFICGTDTDVGKTIVCSGLLKNLPHAHALKVIQTGEALFDENTYKTATPRAQCKTLKHYTLAASPHLATKQTNTVLTVHSLSAQIEKEVSENEFTLIEGSGGIFTPINQTETFIDLIAQLGYPVILVIKNTLGAINHCLLSVKTLQYYGIKIKGLIFTESNECLSEEDKLIRMDNPQLIASVTQLPVLGCIPFVPQLAAKDNQIAWNQIAGYLHDAAIEITKDIEDKDHTITEFDQQHLWHPYTNATDQARNWIVEKTKGCSIYLSNGQRLLDGMSSWWTAIHGYAHPTLLQALNEQATQMPHIMFGGLTHKPAVHLGQRLLSIVPKGLSNVFYTDSGSVAVEVAMKMALQYFQATGLTKKNKFISFYGGYHGDTFGAMSVCDPINGMHTVFEHVLPKNIFAPRPNIPFGHVFDPSSLTELKTLVQQHQYECAAMIIEPIVQGAGGMWFYHPEYLTELKKICVEHNILLIIDEIATGFGRTGKLFACEWANITPDIMCIGKALTGGTMTLAATLTTKKVAQGISEQGHVLMHGPTFMANPLACHVALTSIDLLLQSDWQKNIQIIEHILQTELMSCLKEDGVADVRVLGAIGVVQMKTPINTKKLQHYFVEQHGVWIRPFRDLIYIMPPFTITSEEVYILTNAIKCATKEGVWA